jgi:hypothetical protein
MLATSANEVRLWDTDNAYQIINEYKFSKPVNSFSVDPKSNYLGLIVARTGVHFKDFYFSR